MELTLICVGEESKVNSLIDLVAYQHELIIFTANEEIAAEVRNCGFDWTYSCSKEQDFTSICKCIKKVILLGDELQSLASSQNTFAFLFKHLLLLLQGINDIQRGSMKQLELHLSCLRIVIIYLFIFE